MSVDLIEKFGYTQRSWGMKPTPEPGTEHFDEPTLWPNISTRPFCGLINPAISLMRVVFPAELAPNSEYVDAFGTDIVILLRIGVFLTYENSTCLQCTANEWECLQKFSLGSMVGEVKTQISLVKVYFNRRRKQTESTQYNTQTK